MSEILTGIISGVIASIIVLITTAVHEYRLRMQIEKCKIYELENIGERDALAPPEYPRETIFRLL